VQILECFRSYFRFRVRQKELIPLIISHLESLTENLDQYFPSLSSEMYDWVRNPFVDFSTNSQNLLSLQEEQQLTELQCYRTLKIKFNEVLPDVFLDFNKNKVSCDLS
jgi:hypothetical protein